MSEDVVVSAKKRPVWMEHGDDARISMARGIEKLARAVGCTMGPWGRTVLIEDTFGTPIATRDGVTVAAYAKDLADSRERLGSRILHEAAKRVADECGDGTTTTIVMAASLFRQCMRLVSSGCDPCGLAKEVKDASRVAIHDLMAESRLMTDQDLEAVISAACKGDDRIIGPVAAANRHVGLDGTIALRDGDRGRVEVEMESGYRIDRGWIDSGFALLTHRVELRQCFVLVTTRTLLDYGQIEDAMHLAAANGKSLLVIANNTTGSAKESLLGNNREGALACCAVHAPSYGDLQQGTLQDIAAWTGGRLLDDHGRLPTDGLGYVDRAVVTHDRTILTDPNPHRPPIDARLAYLREMLGKLDNEYDLDKVRQRIGRLSGKIAEIRAGAPTDLERTEVKHRIEDSIGAVRVAWREGLSAGGGMALVRSATRVRASMGTNGSRALANALEEPCRRLHANGGHDGELAVSKARAGGSPPVLDPTAVQVASVRAAVSAVTTLLLAETSLVHYEPD